MLVDKINPVVQIQCIYDSIPPEHPEAGQKYQTSKAVVYLVIYGGIGFAELYRVSGVISIGVFVHPEYRGRGFGKKLVMACQDYVKKQHEALEWYVNAENQASRRLARSCGFRLIKQMSNKNMKTYLWEY